MNVGIIAVTILTFGVLVSGQQYNTDLLSYRQISQDNRHNRIESAKSIVSPRFNSPAVFPESSRSNGPVVFPDPDVRGTSPVTHDGNSSRVLKPLRKIPVSFMKALSNTSSLEFLFRKYVKNVGIKLDFGKKILVKKGDMTPIIGANKEKIVISDSTYETSSTDGSHMRVAVLSERTATKPQKITQSAACQPESRTVELDVKFDPHIIYIPRCVRLERCGGCCATDILSCEPSEKKPVEVLVNKFAYIGDEKTEEMSFMEQESVMMEHHTKCECKCRVKEENCSSKHVYVEDECQCVCQNREEHEKCATQRHKIWDANTCECSCREIKDCNSGYVFSLRSCLCEALPSTLDPSGRKGRKRRTHTRQE